MAGYINIKDELLGKIRRLSRGIYDYPQTSTIVGPVPPDPYQVAQLRQQLSEAEKNTLRKNIALPPAWIAAYFRLISHEPLYHTTRHPRNKSLIPNLQRAVGRCTLTE